MTYLQQFIEWTWSNPIEFFLALAIQYAFLALNERRLKRWPVVGYPLFWLFVIQDWWMDKLMIILFLDPPRSWGQLVTKRMDIYVEEYHNLGRERNFIQSWRYWFGIYLCKMLNRFDPGHCGEKVLGEK